MFVPWLLLNYSRERHRTFADYGGPPGKWPPLVKDARPTVVLAYSFHFRYFPSRRTAIFSNYHFRLLAPSQQRLENRLANYLLRLPLRKQSLRALEMLISEAKVRVRAFQSLPWFPNAQKKRKNSQSKTTPTEKGAHTFRAFDEAPSTMRRSREVRRRRVSMLVSNKKYITKLNPACFEPILHIQSNTILMNIEDDGNLHKCSIHEIHNDYIAVYKIFYISGCCIQDVDCWSKTYRCLEIFGNS